MSLRLKVLLATTLGVALSLLLLGTFALSNYRSTTINNLSSRLSDTVREINDIEDSPLQAAFYLSTVANFPLLVGVADSAGEITSLSETELPLNKMSPALLEKIQVSTLELESAELLLRAISLDDTGYVVLATDLKDVNQTLANLQRTISFAALLLILSTLSFLHLITRGDFRKVRRLVEQANIISAGDYKAEITSLSGSSEVAQLSQSIASMTTILQDNAENLQVLFGSISHELKTPLTAIKGYVELLENSSTLTPEQEKSLDIIQREVERMTSLINDLLLVSKLGTLNYELNDEFDVVQVLNERLQVLRDLQPERPVEVLGERALIVHASRGLLERLFDNLVSNLINHTPPSVPVTFTFDVTQAEWILTYEDNGPGLPMAYSEDTVVSFQKFDPRKSPSSASGLGLFIIQSIVEQHKGNMTATSKDGVRFTFEFPRK